VQMVPRALSVLLLGLTLTACVSNSPGSIKTVLLYPPIDGALLSCASEPAIAEPTTQEEFAVWAEEVRKAGADCRKTLEGLATFIYSWENDVDTMDLWFIEGEG
jgi:hypothetical protein